MNKNQLPARRLHLCIHIYALEIPYLMIAALDRSRYSLDSRPIKIRPGTYCRGDSAHALQITQNMGNRTTNVKP